MRGHGDKSICKKSIEFLLLLNYHVYCREHPMNRYQERTEQINLMCRIYLSHISLAKSTKSHNERVCCCYKTCAAALNPVIMRRKLDIVTSLAVREAADHGLY
jgi:hypothetical protein